MGLRFRDSFELFPGVRLNFSGSGISATFGVPGASVNVGAQGIRSTIGLPGTGISYTHNHSGRPAGGISSRDFTPPPQPTPSYAFAQAQQMREINSAAVEELTSHNLVELRNLIAQARSQHSEITADLNEAVAVHAKESDELKRKQRSIIRFLFKRRIAALEESIPIAEAEVERLRKWLDSTHVDIKFETSDEAKKAYGALVRAFTTLQGCSKIWDITSDRHTDRVIERSAASRTITRTTVTLSFAKSDLVRFEGKAMQFQNINGEDILIYPGIVVMPRADGAFALIDIRELELDSRAMRFVEEEAVPRDAEVVDRTWAKVNKDGSPDRRFRDNYQIPICLYGRILFTSRGGVEEEYQFSNAGAAADFGRAFEAFKSSLAT